MVLKQKYIEDDKIKCSFDDYFIDELILLPYEVSIEIMVQVGRNSADLPEKEGWSQMVGGVVKGKSPYFFELEYVKPKGGDPMYVDIMRIDCDDYLDYINLNKYLK
jgi:hypothetical protein